MNFFDFLEQSTPETTVAPGIPVTPGKSNAVAPGKSNVCNTETSEQIVEKKILKNGDYVKVIRYKNSPLNYYVGYIGEIRNKRMNTEDEYVTVLLHAPNNAPKLKFHIDQLTIIPKK